MYYFNKIAVWSKYVRKTLRKIIDQRLCVSVCCVITGYKTLWKLSSVRRELKTANDGQWTLNYPFFLPRKTSVATISERRKGKRGEGLDLFLLCRPHPRSSSFSTHAGLVRRASLSSPVTRGSTHGWVV